MANEYSRQFKQQIRIRAAVATMLSGAAPFVVGLLALQMVGDEIGQYGPLLLAVGCFVAGALLPWLVQSRMALAGNRGLRRRVFRRLQNQYPDSSLNEADFVGFSPGDKLHVWHGETDRDVGFLQLVDDELIYIGDEYHWSLPRNQVDHIDMTPLEGGMQRILIHWHQPREAGQTFTMESREASNLRQAQRATRWLYYQLREWAREPGGGEGATTGLGFPPTDMRGAQNVDQPASGSCLALMASTVITLMILWRVSSALIEYQLYYHAILWAGLISVSGALTTGYLLHYLQVWEAERRQ